MKISKIFKGIIGIGAVSGIAYTAYKLGEMTGEVNERFRQKYDEDNDSDDCEDDVEPDNNYVSRFDMNKEVAKYEYSEPDDECLAPATNEESHNFAPLEKVKGVSRSTMKKLVLNILYRKFVSNKTVRDIIGVDFDKAAEVLKALENAGYIGADSGNHKMPVYLTYRDYDNLFRK